MVQGPSFAAITTLGDLSVPVQERLRIAKHLKNLIVGHDQRKELAVRHGLVEPLANTITSGSKGKRKLESNGVSLHAHADHSTADDDLRLQAILIVSSLASGGQSQPLCAVGLPKFLVETLAGENGSRLAVATLQALKALASFWSSTDEPSESDFWSTVFNAESIETFDTLLRLAPKTQTGQKQLGLVASIIAALPEHKCSGIKDQIANSGLLDTLSSLLVAHAIQNKIVWYARASSQAPPAPSELWLPSVLAAISSVIIGSNWRAHRFTLSAAVRDLFLNPGADNADQRAQLGPRYGFASPYGTRLPPLHIPAYKTVSHGPPSGAFPALRTLQDLKQSNGSADNAHVVADIDHSNAVCGWLLVLTRSLRASDRLCALRLLALISNAIDSDPAGSSARNEVGQKSRERHRQLALLAVPLAVQLVQIANDGRPSDKAEEQLELTAIQEQACSVLALLIGGVKEMQIAAVEAGAVKYVCPILKKSFDHVPAAKPVWSAKPATQLAATTPASCRPAMRTFPRELEHAMRCRESALKALAAIAAKEDLHRKAIIDAGVISCIIDSLKPLPENAPRDTHDRIHVSPKDGNIARVILAACAAAQSMSRSVSVLRTSLIDGGIAKPLIALLNHEHLQVQIAATDVCCNLLPDFSPMREDLSEGEVVRTLADHARSSSPDLRLSSMWALKHLISNCPKEVKLAALEELGTGWLVGIIQGESRDTAGGGVSVGLSTPNAAGEQVDLLNPASMDLDEPVCEAAERMEEDDDEDGEMLYDEASSTHYQSSQLRSTLDPTTPAFNTKRYLSSIRELEQNSEYASRRNEAAIQQQALDFVRNFINGDDCTVLSDYLMNAIGSAKVYELLTAKLSPVARSGGRQIYNTTELVLATIHVLVHLANASAKHRQLFIAQRPLLQAMLPHFSHVDHRIRVMSVWTIVSLTFLEDGDDRRDAHQRRQELKNIGIEQAVRALQNDPNLDVRERVKTAIRQFENL
ncbi:Putative armadillo-type containing protein ARMC8/Vid28 [Septoria linicola]|uniref:Armadillo-type containing protein ARMC8/Vid28 n=1 Tax=Septoria linicola TaxID=215465 RepID=A0A9Q9EHE2_9PEZI|nr:putative armadillo-type containing protein ARMC8/Vid28 [Septoria linicola]USW49218.1 Putative armadillo-type containing protein ARMC8/Vid28 [Septoria linicola]